MSGTAFHSGRQAVNGHIKRYQSPAKRCLRYTYFVMVWLWESYQIPERTSLRVCTGVGAFVNRMKGTGAIVHGRGSMKLR